MATAREQAYENLEKFEACEDAPAVSCIETQAGQLRQTFREAGESIEPGSALDQRIAEASRRLNFIGAQHGFATLMDMSAPAAVQYIDKVRDGIYGYFAAAGQPVEKGSAFDQQVAWVTNRAYITAAEKKLAWLEELEAPQAELYSGDTLGPIDRMSGDIRAHFTAAGAPADIGSPADLRIRGAIERAHAVSAVRLLEALETDADRAPAEIDLQAGRIRAHFAKAGMEVDENSALADRINGAAANAKLLGEAVAALPAAKPEYPPDLYGYMMGGF